MYYYTSAGTIHTRSYYVAEHKMTRGKVQVECAVVSKDGLEVKWRSFLCRIIQCGTLLCTYTK